jgi:hypothetical protein
MTTGPEAQAGGNPNQLSTPVADILHPVDAARAEMHDLLATATEFWAPGPASADWEDWAAATAEPAVSAFPRMVRIGTAYRGEALLSPLLGESHIVVGDPALLRHTPMPKPTTSQVTEVKERAKIASEEYLRRERLRRSQLGQEHDIAVQLTQNVVTRTVATMAPGSVETIVYDPRDRGLAFRALGQLGQNNALRIVPPDGLHKLLKILDSEITAMNSGLLGGYGSLRAQVRYTGQGVRPWRVVALLAHNEALDPQGNERLQTIIRQGAACGISLIVHGLHVEDGVHVNAIRRTKSGHLVSSNTGPLRITPDKPAPEAIMRHAAYRATQPPPAVRPEAPRELPENLAVRDSQGRTFMAGYSYQRLIEHRSDTGRSVGRVMGEFEQAHPYLDPYMLSSLEVGAAGYREFANAAAADPAVARRAAARRPRDEVESILSRLEAWAMLELLTGTPGHVREHITHINRGTLASGETPAHLIPDAIDIVRTTRWHGLDRVPDIAVDYLLQYLPSEPPVYMFQLVADLGSTTGDLVPKHRAQDAMDATVAHLEFQFGVPLRDSQSNGINRPLTEALVECELFRMYDFMNATPQLQTLLVQRAYRRMQRVTMDELPPSARNAWNECMRFLDANGGPVLSLRQRTGRAAGSAITSAATSAKNTLLGALRPKEKPAADEAPQGPLELESKNGREEREERMRRLLNDGPHIFRPDDEQPGERA